MINTIDLFAGCGGLMEGFERHGDYKTLACVEWEKVPCENLINRLETRWKHSDAEKEVIRFDIQRTDELFNGFEDEEYGKHEGLDALVGDKRISMIIGGPPCQAYSLAGRIRDRDGMRNDYRNYLFESYIKVVKHYSPSFFIFENVQGMLSATPNGKLIIDEIKERFEEAGYKIIDDFKSAVFDLTEYGVPQNRKRVIIFGINKEVFGNKSKKMIKEFYHEIMPDLKCDKVTVRESIGDLPQLFPTEEYKLNGKKYSHTFDDNIKIFNHYPRFHNERDINTFRMLAEDIAHGTHKYSDSNELKKLYKGLTGKESNVHKYYVIRWDEQSNTIPAHLYKDGLRHIHPDFKQARSITVREAARLQTFDDDFKFIGGTMHQYKMIGNAVPPKFSLALAKAVKQIMDVYC